MPQPLMLKKLKLNSFVKTYKTFYNNNNKKRCPFHHRRMECKSRKSRDTWSNRQIWPCNTKWSRAKAYRVFSREHTGHSKPLFQKPNGPLYTWTSPDGQFWNQIDYILCSWRWRNSMQSAKTRAEVDCGSDHELLISKFMFKFESRESH